jgi:surface polysaccharide O-acyltransferase-like enzyme
MNNETINNKMDWVDNLRVLATISVIFVHVTGNIYEFNKEAITGWWFANIFNGGLRFCVPVFFMLTGALTLSKEISIPLFFKKRVSRVLIPFMLWSVLYTLFSLKQRFFVGNGVSIKETGLLILNQLQFSSSYHFWYIYVLLGLYLFSPIMGKWLRNANSSEMLYFIIIWLVINTLSQPLFEKYRTGIELRYFTGYLGYIVLGYYLAYTEFENRKRVLVVSWILFSVGVLVTLFGTYYLSNKKNWIDLYFYDYVIPNVIAASIGIFLIIKNYKLKNKLVMKIRDFIAKYSFGVYLCHVMILQIIEPMGISWKLIGPGTGIIITTIVCLILCLVLVYSLSKVRFLKYLSGVY